MASFLQSAKNLYGQAIAKTGAAMGNVGTALHLPEMNISERAAKYNPFNPPAANAQVLSSQSTYQAPNSLNDSLGLNSYTGYQAPNSLNDSLGLNSYTGNTRTPTTNTNTGGGGNYGNTMNTQTQNGINQINENTNDYGAIIDQEYNDQMGMLAGQEAGVGEQVGLSNRTAETGALNAQNAYSREGETKIGAQQQNISTGQTQGATAMQQARDLFRQTQQQNIAQLSGLGISSSSVAEAMAETLGVETARRIAGVTGSVNEIVQNATKEIGNIKGYVAQKQTEVDNDLKIKRDEIQAWANAQLGTINAARNQAATAKAQQRLELFSNAQQLVSNLVNQAQTYQAQIEQWAAQKASSLSQYTTPESATNLLNQMMANLQQTYSPTQYDISGKMNYNNTAGYYPTTSVTSKKKTTETDELANPFAT